MKPNRVIVASSRGFNDYSLLDRKLTHLLSKQDVEDVEIVSGGARGADKLGEAWAEHHGYDFTVFPADWDRLGKRAGYLRNQQMAEYATHLVAFWDGVSKGTAHMIDLARKKGLKVVVVSFD